MKKIVILLAFILSATTAEAWIRRIDQSAIVLAMQHLTPAVKERVEQIAKGKVKEQVHALPAARKRGEMPETKGWHALHLDSNLNVVEGVESDAVTQIERAANVLRSHATNTDAENLLSLQILFNLLPDMHSVSNVRIEGVEWSNKNFEFIQTSGKEGTKGERVKKYRWRTFWYNRYFYHHSAFSAEFFAEDMEVAYGARREAFQSGSVRDWAHDVGVSVKPLYDWAAPDYVMCNKQHLELEDLYFTLVAKSAYRLAALLNEVLK
ncbi:MAG: hypothetical protein IKA49_00425 [Alistipes sp.]|nr:hypothetical protein [Alistipes sp.]